MDTISSDPVVRPLPAWLRRKRLYAFLAACLLAPMTWCGRNLASDAIFFAATRQNGGEAAYRAYLASGWRHQEEVRRELPRIALAEATRKGTVTAFRDYLDRYHGASTEADARSALHALYLGAHDRYQHLATKSTPPGAPIIRALFAYLEAHRTSSLIVRLDPPSREAMAGVLRAAAGLGSPASSIVLPFGAEARVRRQAVLVTRLDGVFKRVFTPDMLVLRASLDQPESSDDAAPALSVAYTIQPTSIVFESRTNRNRYMGIATLFSLRLQIPDGSPPYVASFTVPPPERLSIAGDRVYEGMADYAFDRAIGSIRALLFDGLDPVVRQASR